MLVSDIQQAGQRPLMAVAEAWQDAARASRGSATRRCSRSGRAGVSLGGRKQAEMAVPAMAQIVADRVSDRKTPHEFRQSRGSTAQRYVGMVRHKRPAVN